MPQIPWKPLQCEYWSHCVALSWRDSETNCCWFDDPSAPLAICTTIRNRKTSFLPRQVCNPVQCGPTNEKQRLQIVRGSPVASIICQMHPNADFWWSIFGLYHLISKGFCLGLIDWWLDISKDLDKSFIYNIVYHWYFIRFSKWAVYSNI